MDPYTGNLWTEEQLAELGRTDEVAARELRERLVHVEGSEESLAELAANVAVGKKARADAQALSELERLTRERIRREWRRAR